MAAAMLPMAMGFAKKNQLLSRGLKGLGGSVKNKTLKKLLGIGGGIAGAFGLSKQAQIGVSRNGRRRQRGGQGRQRGPRGNAGGVGMFGGVTVQAANAPIQFARSDEIRPFTNVFNRANGCQVHAAVQVEQSTPVPDNGWNCVVDQYVNPSDPNYRWISDFANLWKKWQIRNLRIHYQHYESTVVAGEVVLKYTPDPDDNLIAFLEGQVGNSSNFVRGAVYEDFMLEVDLSGVPKIPMDVDFSESNPDDAQAGRWAAYINHWNPPTGGDPPEPIPSPAPGNFYLEFVVDFTDRYAPLASASRIARIIKDKKLVRAEKLELIALLLDEHERETSNRRFKGPPVDHLLERLKLKAKPAATPIPAAALRTGYQSLPARN